ESAIRGGHSGARAIVPGEPEESEIIRRITSDDPSERMPPAKHGKPLSAKQIETLKQWIRDGAPYETHWAFNAPRKVPLPAVGEANPIDAFVTAHLNGRGLSLSHPAAGPILLRRLSLDLIGLPPSPADQARLEKIGFTAMVERLLQSERFGEKWA